MLVTAGLDEPCHVAVDAQGNLLVTDRGASQQVKKFTRDGKLLSVYGQPGGRDNNGKSVPDKLRNPAGICVAPSGKVFFSEDAEPKFFERLTSDLKYEKLWAGPWYVSGEVCVDPAHPEYVYSRGGPSFIRHRVDYAAKTSTPDAVWTDFAMTDHRDTCPRVVDYQGHTYLVAGGVPASIYRVDGYQMRLVSNIGFDWQAPGRPAWVYTDLNDDGKLDEGDKVTVTDWGALPPFRGAYWGGTLDPRDMSWYLLSNDSPNRVYVVTPTWPRPGVPLYDLTKARVISLAAAQKPLQSLGFSSIFPGPDGGVIGNADAQGSDPRGVGHSSHLSDVYVWRVDRDGNLLWRVGKKASGIAKNGEFYGRACSVGGWLGDDYFQFVDENGQDKVYTLDGLFVGNLLDDSATATPSEYTLFVEHFGSVVYQNALDKQWYFIAGASGYASIWRIAGLDKVTRLEAVVKVGG
jgi:hypothetical protein